MDADLRDADKVSIDIFPDEILLEVFDFWVENEKGWVTLVHVCQRWRAIVFAAPSRLNLQLVCTYRTPVAKMSDIWPALPIDVRMWGKGNADAVDANVLDALKHRNRVGKIYADNASNGELKDLAEAMQDTFPALTYLFIESMPRTASSLPESLLGGSAPNLRSLFLMNVAFPALPKLPLSVNHLVDLHLSFIPPFGVGSSEEMADCLSSLTRLKRLQMLFQSSQTHSARPDRARRRPHPLTLTHIVLPALSTLFFQGKAEYLDHVFAHIDAPLLKDVGIRFPIPPTFDVPRIVPFVGGTETFESLNQAYMIFPSHHHFVDVLLSSRKVTAGDKMLRLTLSFEMDNLTWELQGLTQICRPPGFEPLDLCNRGSSLSLWEERMESAPWMELVRFFTATEYMYLSHGLAVCALPALQELIAEGMTGVLPGLRNLFVERLESLGRPSREAIDEFVAARRLLSSHAIDVQLWVRGERVDSSGR